MVSVSNSSRSKPTYNIKKLVGTKLVNNNNNNVKFLYEIIHICTAVVDESEM